MNTNFLVWGNGSHEFSLNNRNPKSRRLYCNKRDFNKVEIPGKKIEQVLCKDNCLLIIIEGELYKKGYFNWEIEDFENYENKIFQQIKDSEDSLPIEKINSFKDEKNFQVKEIKFGFNHILILTQEMNVYAWGDNYYGQLGINNQMIPMQSSPIRVLFPDNIKIDSVYAFKNNSFAIDINGGLWAWGKYEYIKQDNSRNVFSPIRIFPEDRKVKKLFFMDERVIVEVEDSLKIQEPAMALGNTTNFSVQRTSINVNKFSVFNTQNFGDEKPKKNQIDDRIKTEEAVPEEDINFKVEENKGKSVKFAEEGIQEKKEKAQKGSKAIDIKANMEKDSLLKYYDDCKVYVKKILDAIESCDTSVLKKIQILTQNKKSFILESHIQGFWIDFKQQIDIQKIRENYTDNNNLKRQEAKMYEAFICYLLEIFLDEFKIDEYNLGNIYKQHHKRLEGYLKNVKKAQNLDQTIEMNNSLKKLADYSLKYKKLQFFIYKLSANLYLFKSLKFKNVIDSFKRIFEEKDSRDMNIESKLTFVRSSFTIMTNLLVEIDKSLSYVDKLKDQIKQGIIDSEEKTRELYVYDYLINSIMEIRELWELLMKMTNEYLKLQIKNDQFAYYFEVQQKLYSFHKYILSIDILSDKKAVNNKDDKNKVSNDIYDREQATRCITELDGAIAKIDSLLKEELQNNRLDNFSNAMNKNYAQSIKDIALQKKVNIFLMMALNVKCLEN